MPPEFQDPVDAGDGLDFRPLSSQPTQKKPAPQSRAGASDEIDFRPAVNPATFNTLYKTPPAEASLTDRAARVGIPSPLVQSFAPKSADLTRVPVDPFTNRYITGPPMATEEEKQREGVLAARPQGVGERIERALGAGAPEGSKVAEWTGQHGTKDNPRLFAPEQLMTEAEQQRHPILTGAGEFAGGMTSPESLMLIGLTAGAGELAGPGAAVAKRLMSAGFSIPMLVNAARLTPEIADAFRRGDTATGERLLTQAALSAGTAGLAGRGMFEETAPATVPRGTISRALALDERVASGDRAAQVNAQAQTGLENVDSAASQALLRRVIDRAGRVMPDVQANAAARRGMGNLANAERVIEAARQARINAPVQVPKTYEGTPPILPGPPQGPERNPLEVEAQRVREERGAREPDFRVLDLRRVVPENSEEQPYYELAPTQAPSTRRTVQLAPAGETVGARGRSVAVSQLASRVVPQIENSLVQRFTPDVLDEARQEINAAAGLASSFERPGRYFGEYGDQNEYMPSRSTNAAKGIHAGGTWYGITSARPAIEEMHPWFRDVAEGPETFARIAQEGKGPAYDRLLERAATHIQSERESAQPVIEEFAPQLRSLAGQVRDVDPDLAETLESLAQGKSVGFSNLREYIQGKLHDAQAAALFSKAVDEAASEAGQPAGAAQPSRMGGETRATEGRGEEAARQSAPPVAPRARGEIDFQPLPEPEPINPQEVEDISRALGRRVTAEELPGIRRRLEAERNVEAGLRGERRDVAGEIREQHRAMLERGEREPARPPEGYFPLTEPELDSLSTQLGRPATQADAHLLRRAYDFPKAREEGVPLGIEAAGREQRRGAAAERERNLTEDNYEAAGKKLGIEYRGVMGADAGLGDRAVVTYQDPVSRGSIGIRVGEWSPEKVEERLAEKREELRPGERYSGVHPRALVQGARILQRAWNEKIAQPLINKVLKIGDKYQKTREADPAVAEGLHLLDNAPTYLRAKAAQEVHNIIGNLSRAQERLFTLLADADSRENLRANHPDEYRQAQRDPAIQEALRKYRPIEQELTKLRGKMGGEVLDQDYLRRVYEKHVAGVNKPEAPSSSGERATSAYDRVIRPQRIGNLSREATAEYHYERGLHEFGPAFATKFIGTHLRALRDQVAHEFIDKATMLPAGTSEPRFIMYNGERYYRPDLAREMRAAGAKNVKTYDRYDPTAGEKFPVPADGKFLGPREVVKELTDYGRKEDSGPGALRRFFQEQILGFGFGIPHIANIMRRVSQSVPGGAVNPKGWVDAWRTVLSKELRDRGISGLNDPTFDMLARHGAISTGEFANLKEYWGGNLNPANWARSLAKIGHEVLFNPEAAKGFGGIDQRARLYIADLVRSQRPSLTDEQVAAAVRTQLGDYNRANWTDRQKMLGKFMMFPGWDFSSVKWVLEHPIKTTVPPALLVLLANQALHQLGQNRPEDRYDISNIHVGDRAYGTSLVRESVARNLFRPAIAYAQSKVRGESDQRAMAAASRGVTAGAGGLLSMLRPDLSGFLALATNRQGLFSSKEIVSKDDYQQPGKILPSRAIEKQAVFSLRHAVPALDRMLDFNEDIDLRSFAGGNLGVSNYRDDAEKRLLSNAAEAEEVHRTIGKLAKSNPDLAREYVKDPDNAAFALFYHDLTGLTTTLKRMDEAKSRIETSGLPSDDKKARIATIDKARQNLLEHADGLSNLLFERRQRGKAGNALSLPGFFKRLRMAASAGAQP